MAPGPSFYIVYNLIYFLLITITPLVTFHYFIHFIIQLTALFSARPERLTTFPPLGAKYFGWVCAGPRLLKVKRQRSSKFTSLLISKSYWFDKPRFVKRGKTATNCNSAFGWGTTQLILIQQNPSPPSRSANMITVRLWPERYERILQELACSRNNPVGLLPQKHRRSRAATQRCSWDARWTSLLPWLYWRRSIGSWSPPRVACTTTHPDEEEPAQATPDPTRR